MKRFLYEDPTEHTLGSRQSHFHHLARRPTPRRCLLEGE